MISFLQIVISFCVYCSKDVGASASVKPFDAEETVSKNDAAPADLQSGGAEIVPTVLKIDEDASRKSKFFKFLYSSFFLFDNKVILEVRKRRVRRIKTSPHRNHLRLVRKWAFVTGVARPSVPELNYFSI